MLKEIILAIPIINIIFNKKIFNDYVRKNILNLNIILMYFISMIFPSQNDFVFYLTFLLEFLLYLTLGKNIIKNLRGYWLLFITVSLPPALLYIVNTNDGYKLMTAYGFTIFIMNILYVFIFNILCIFCAGIKYLILLLYILIKNKFNIDIIPKKLKQYNSYIQNEYIDIILNKFNNFEDIALYHYKKVYYKDLTQKQWKSFICNLITKIIKNGGIICKNSPIIKYDYIKFDDYGNNLNEIINNITEDLKEVSYSSFPHVYIINPNNKIGITENDKTYYHFYENYGKLIKNHNLNTWEVHRTINSIIDLIYSYQNFLDNKINIEEFSSKFYLNINNIFIEYLQDKLRFFYYDIDDDIEYLCYLHKNMQILNLVVSCTVLKILYYIINVCKYEKIPLFIENVDGFILDGNYKGNFIYINHDNEDYEIYLWKKNNNRDGLILNIKTYNEMLEFFDKNRLLVKWEDTPYK